MHPAGFDGSCDASRRHLSDARILLGEARFDGAIHAAGFAAECALKASLAGASTGGYDGKHDGHDLVRLGGRAWSWAAAAVGGTALRHAVAGLAGSAVAHEHPHRRYWGRHWSAGQAAQAAEEAAALVRALVWQPILDQGRAWGED